MRRWSWTLLVTATVAIAHAAAQDRPARGEQRPTKNPLEGNAPAISNGGAMFRTRCAGCHGPDARGYVGPDLTGVWLAGSTDDRLFDIVRRGIPGTEMTPADPLRVSDRDIWQVLAFLRTLGAVTSAPPTGTTPPPSTEARSATCRNWGSSATAPRRPARLMASLGRQHERPALGHALQVTQPGRDLEGTS